MNLDPATVVKQEETTEEDPFEDAKDLIEQNPLAVVRTPVKEERIEDVEQISVKEEIDDKDLDLKSDINVV